MDFHHAAGLDYYDDHRKEPEWVDLAPDICRQRMIVEGTLHSPFLPEKMTQYCNEITKIFKNKTIE